MRGMRPRPKPIAIYARQSDDTSGLGMAVARQVQECRALARALGLGSDVELFVDNDVSATKIRKRGEYQRLLEAIKAGEHDTLLIWHNDRLHRRPIELEEFIEIAEAADL